ncbi:Auxin-induced protein 15A [Hibiscus syriacus]|uniref:Auxin-induced protein 15A n=1 Tax=Hibiscus syriacus TaxID=106335 RepID=A0A6A2YEN1_HIBSY|nr:Auxin-induced protein 15A [Hibiscus syriacus]
MGIHLPSVILHAKQALKLQSKHQTDVPKGHIAVFVGKIHMTRFVVPISYLSHPSFLDLLHWVEEEFGFDHPMGGLTIPCDQHVFIHLTSRLHVCS